MNLKSLQKYAHQTNIRLMIGGLLLLFFVGDGLIYIIYGFSASLLGLLCLMGGLAPVFVIILVLGILEWIVSHSN